MHGQNLDIQEVSGGVTQPDKRGSRHSGWGSGLVPPDCLERYWQPPAGHGAGTNVETPSSILA